MTKLTLTLLGSFGGVLEDRSVINFVTDKSRALLAYLAVERQRPHRREALAALLWPDQPEERARQSLRQCLLHLRQALKAPVTGPPFLWIEYNLVQIHPEAQLGLDVADFTAVTAAIENHPHRHRESCLPCFQRAVELVSLYQGEFLAGFHLADSALFEEWVLLKREWLHIRAVEALALLAEIEERRGKLEEARRYAQQLVQLEPWREEAHRQLMRLTALTGQRSAALAQYENCRRVLQAEFNAGPTVKTQQLFEQIRDSQDFSSPRVSSLPIPAAPLVGRQAELVELAELLAVPTCRLITLTGPGGIGKTRLALQVAEEHRGLYPDGEYWIDLSSINAGDLIVPMIALQVGFTLYGKEPPVVQLINYLRERRALLILDNAEHLPELGLLVSDLLNQVPGIALVVTSRERLFLREEQLFVVEGLPYQPSFSVPCPEAVAFFIQCARRIHRKFEPDSQELESILVLSRLVDGFPLALELAAAWISQYSCAEIAAALSRDMDLLTTLLRNVPARQRSMRITFEHSWALLLPAERSLLARLSVFRGGFTAVAAGEIADADSVTLKALEEKSLIHRAGDGRWHLHELLRQFAAEKLSILEAGRLFTADRHADYYAEFLAGWENVLKGKDQDRALASIHTEIGNVRRAWEWALEVGKEDGFSALKVFRTSFESLFLFFALRSWYQEGAVLFARAAEVVGEKDRLLAGELRTRQARCLEFTAPAEEAIRLYRENLELFQQLGAEHQTALPLYGLGYMAHLRGEYDEARRYFLNSLERYQAWDNRWGAANVLSSLCLSLRRQGKYQEALRSGRQSLEIRRDLGDRRGIASSQNNLGLVFCAVGDFDAARRAFQESLALCLEMGLTIGAANTLTGLCQVAMNSGDIDEAIHCQEQARDLYHEIGDLWGMAIAFNNLGQLQIEKGEIAKAGELLREGIRLYRRAGIKAGLSNALSNLGRVCETLGEIAEAGRYFHEALMLSLEIGDLPFGLDTLYRVADLWMRLTDSCRPLTAMAFVLHHPALLEETRRVAQESYRRLKNDYAPVVVAVAEEEASRTDFDTMVAEVLAFLKKMESSAGEGCSPVYRA